VEKKVPGDEKGISLLRRLKRGFRWGVKKGEKGPKKKKKTARDVIGGKNFRISTTWNRVTIKNEGLGVSSL